MSDEPATVAQLSDAAKWFDTERGRVDALRSTTIEVARGSAIGITGPSGGGKTTLLHLMGLLLEPSSGAVRLEGREMADEGEPLRDDYRRRYVGFVYQQALLVPHLDALANVIVGRPGLGEGAARELLDRFGVGDLAHRVPAQLSGGEQQRVALARGLLHDPSLLLADEPTSNLDDESAQIVVTALAEHAGAGRSVVMASHDPRMLEACDHTVRIEDGQIVDDGS